MANSILTAGAALRAGPSPEEPKPMAEEKKDTRVWMYREGEARLFNSPEEIPEGEGWVDHPDKSPKRTPIEKARAARAAKRAAQADESSEE